MLLVGSIVDCIRNTSHLTLPFDLSYGLYIWHMPVINLLLVFNLQSLWAAIALTPVFATTSWFLVEKPMLKLERSSLKS